MARSDSDFYSQLLAAVFSGENDNNCASHSGKNTEAFVSKEEKIYNLIIDDQNRVRCPECNKGVRLASKNIDQFKCTSCKTEIRFKS
jgi:tRNA(Ile2) C34 agmatinyltransferase TiaS